MGNHRADRRGHSRGPSVTPVDSPVSSPAPGRRRADKQTSGLAARRSSRRGPLFRGLPSAPILLGVAALVASGFGAVTATDTGLVGATNVRFLQASALTGASDISRVNLLDSRSATVSRRLQPYRRGRRQARRPGREPSQGPQRHARQVREAGRGAGGQDRPQPVGPAPGRLPPHRHVRPVRPLGVVPHGAGFCRSQRDPDRRDGQRRRSARSVTTVPTATRP